MVSKAIQGHTSTIFLSITGRRPKVIMAPASGEGNKKGSRYVVAVTPSSSPNRRFLVFILAAVALVTLVLLATIIPIYVKGSGKNKSNHGK